MRCDTSSHFFFKAEDVIRDTSVTGVQTCALPISVTWSQRYPDLSRRPVQMGRRAVGTAGSRLPRAHPVDATHAACSSRSEERRVGKGGKLVVDWARISQQVECESEKMSKEAGTKA